MISNSKNKQEKIYKIDKNFSNEKTQLLQLRRYIEKNFNYVERF